MPSNKTLTIKKPLSFEKETQLSEQLKALGLNAVTKDLEKKHKDPEKQQGSEHIESREKKPKPHERAPHGLSPNDSANDTSNDRGKAHDRAQTKKKRAEIQATLTWLCETYPAAFSRDNPKPLKNNIHEDIFLRLSEGHPVKTKIRQALGFYTNGKRYLKSFAEATHRIDLQGIDVEPIAEANKGYAEERRQYFKERFAERKMTRKDSKANKESGTPALSPTPVGKSV